ncbi:MAG: diaminopimelate decarboxylase [Cyclobacteriaceae bacterium]
MSISNSELTQLAETYGAPLYVYDSEKIISQYHALTNAFDGMNLKLKYASKACTNLSVLKLLRKLGSGMDCVSVNEVQMGLQAGFKKEDIIFTPNCVDFKEIEEAKGIGVHINIDNIPFLEQFGKKYGNSYPICIRINPHIQAGGNANIQVGHVGSKFGISILQFKEIVAVVEKYNLLVEGLHVHTGSDILDTDVFLKGANVLFECAQEFKDLRFLDFGSGFKVPYKEGDPSTDYKKLGVKMKAAFTAFCADYGRELEIWFEPGKFMVSESGNFVVQTNVVKPTPACVFAGVNSGFNHLIRPMFYDSFHQINNISNPDGEKKIYNIVGYICETDTFAVDRELSEVRVGDYLVFKNAGAYGFEMGSNFNSRLRPAQVMWHKGEGHLIRKRDEFEDLMRNQTGFEPELD